MIKMKNKSKLIIYLGITLIILLGFPVLFSGCQPSPPSNAIDIGLGQAVSLSQSDNISDVRVESDNGWMVMTVQTQGGNLTIQDAENNQVSVSDGMLLVANIDGMNTADLKTMGFEFPASYTVTRGSPGTASSGNILSALLPLIIFGFLIFLLMRMGSGSARGQINEIGRTRATLSSGNLSNVTDTGEGIPEEHIPHLFERFYKVEDSRTRSEGGAGLGLAIVKQMVQAHGGRVWAESEPGKGSTFYITLPLPDNK